MSAAIEHFLEQKLETLKANSAFRILKNKKGLIDFSSNDYLGLAQNSEIKRNIETELEKYPDYRLGATGSRLISGNSPYAEELEQWLADFHNAESGLLFNSGYDANLGIFSSLPQKGDTIILDEKIHACIIDGSRLSYAQRYKFKHNDLESLESKLKIATGNIFIGIESIYSMDGDISDLLKIIELAESYNAAIIIDEAHSSGILGQNGKGLVSKLGMEDRIFARIHTFGKAIGSHGAVVLGSKKLREYLINNARSFIFTTAAPFHELVSIKSSYNYLSNHPELQLQLKEKIDLFRKRMKDVTRWIPSSTSIQSIIIPGNENVIAAATQLNELGFDVGMVRYPTVARGTERLRICLHIYNSDEQIISLTNSINIYKK
ncbi:aminotransferase class I/II-fold pyridoxal phosphate-dependent enzyme [Solitalea koreensis]|uniref:8-amino-7-oxononanoate synthase n=1 Tax=Solitalea koreensis TaxID=543615 RepID=A0A521BFE0_9SPHI|nr:pyridoxal phosphate-dependent aminotransferase family protein [Solitalea koreensis]SMO45789.1 8-amino-7-oxononanoate synthase [Solitalea koreensis]